MMCTITGYKQYSSNLVQGGIEVSCKITVSGGEKCEETSWFTTV